jgi:hypothetical protein
MAGGVAPVLDEAVQLAGRGRLVESPQYKARVDGVDIHFYYVKGEGSNPLPCYFLKGPLVRCFRPHAGSMS